MGAIKCPSCGRPVAAFETYCTQCGERLTITCSNCGEAWRFWRNYRYCPKCGARCEKPVPGVFNRSHARPVG
ncbi:MAG: zinc ribbon domain-containing protein [Candidatus Fermentithermobacillus carboniphilus]|uniref:Zinc ribbon domain-containing protein n=1 Tax=Candidatus Fermentithermobacillus carboniphilus TaxID=3085328 RepID=A0AAT9LDY4_9FIRM|nr:MAG: zinc ribbon domain-containing protein [Candidatus Fermentithermobacillus carboniphilus]